MFNILFRRLNYMQPVISRFIGNGALQQQGIAGRLTSASNPLTAPCSQYHQLTTGGQSSVHSLAPISRQSVAQPFLGLYTNEVACQQACRGKARGNEYQPSNRKRKTKHGFHKRMKTDGGIAVIWRRLLKGRRLLSH